VAETIDGVKIVRRGSQILGVHLFAPIFYFSTGPYDLVIDQIHGIPFFTPLYVNSRKLAFIHEVAKEVWWLNPWPRPLNLVPGILGSVFEPIIFRLLYRKIPFVTVSESTKKDLIVWDIPKENISVIKNGVTINVPKSVPPKQSQPTAIYLGALTKDKGIEDAIKVFALINQSDPGWQFWVVGKGEDKYCDMLKVTSDKLGLKGRIKFLGFVTEKKKFELLARAHVMLNPSIREGWGLVNIESNSMGTPVVGYNVAGMRDSIVEGETGFLVNYGNYKELTSRVLELIKNEKFYNKIGKKAILWSENFSWEKSTRQSLELVERIF